MKHHANKRLKNLAAALALTMSLPLTTISVSAEGAAPNTNDQPVVATAAADVITLVPLRTLVESIGAEVLWDAATSTATVKHLGKEFAVTIGSNQAVANGEAVTLPHAPQIIDGRTQMPLEFINFTLGTKLGWDAANNEIAIAKDDLTSRASAFVANVAKDQMSAATRHFTIALGKATDFAGLKQYVMGGTMYLGAYKGVTAVESKQTAVHDNVTLTLAFERGTMPFTVRFTKSGEINDIFLSQSPAMNLHQLPSYAKQDAYTEQEVVIGEGTRWALPGTLTMPKGDGPFPVLVLVHGSGGNDRDESMMALKPFKDLAVGLASQGVAVLTYDKRSYEYPAQLNAVPNYTLKDEALDDTLAAVDLMSNFKGIDPKRIHVLGHSQGGLMIPRLVAADTEKRIAGTVVMAAPAGTMQDLLEKQFKYLVEMQQLPKETYEFMKGQFDIMRDPNFSFENKPASFTLPYWWVDLKDYKPAEMAKTQSGKMLLIHGGRDYQVEGSENFHAWQTALADRQDVSYKYYDKLNHFFTEGEGPATPMEYMTPNNVPSYVVDDIAAWIKK